ncbi:hypothetical protein ABIA00_006247 [Bradyrhizobium ottawaense]
MNDNLADYAVPVNADIPDIEVIFVGPSVNAEGTASQRLLAGDQSVFVRADDRRIGAPLKICRHWAATIHCANLLANNGRAASAHIPCARLMLSMNCRTLSRQVKVRA